MAEIESRMEKTVNALKEEYNSIRTGRANASILDRVRVDYYGTPTPINQVGTISIPDARSIVISPFDKSVLGDIEKAIQKAELGLNPGNDGKVIRISIPPLTADRRKELVKQAKTTAENYRTTIRNIRRDGNDDLKKQQKAGEITEDQLKTETDKLQKLTDKYIDEINKVYDSKEKEIKKKKKKWIHWNWTSLKFLFMLESSWMGMEDGQRKEICSEQMDTMKA